MGLFSKKEIEKYDYKEDLKIANEEISKNQYKEALSRYKKALSYVSDDKEKTELGFEAAITSMYHEEEMFKEFCQYINITNPKFKEIKEYYRNKYGKYMSFNDFLEEQRKRINIQKDDYEMSDYYKLADIYTFGRGKYVDANYYAFLYYLGCILKEKWKDEKVWIPNKVSDEGFEYAWDAYCMGLNFTEIKYKLLPFAEKMIPDAITALNETYGYLGGKEFKEKKSYYYIMSKILDVRESSNIQDIYASLFHGKGINIYSFVDILNENSNFIKSNAIMDKIKLWCSRLLGYESSNRSGLAKYLLHKLGKLDIYVAISANYAPAIYEQLTKDFLNVTLNIGNVSESEWSNMEDMANRLVLADVQYGRECLKDIRELRKKNSQVREQTNQANRIYAERKIEAEMKKYGEKLDNNERWFNFLSTDAPFTNKEMTTFGFLTGDKYYRDKGIIGSLAREAKEDRMRKKLIDEELERMKKDNE